MGKILGEREEVPAAKQNMISTRDNSDYKWQNGNGRSVLGALEVPCEPDLDIRGELTARYVTGHEADFDNALEWWNENKLRKQFIKACESVPQASFCCGLLPDQDEWIKNIQKQLTKGWVKATNQKLRSERKEFFIDVYIWNWHNATGKSVTNIILVRFHESKRQSLIKNGSSALFDPDSIDKRSRAEEEETEKKEEIKEE